MDNASIKKLEADLWESADLLRAGSKLTSNQYCMPVLGLLFLRYAYSRYKMVEEKILKDRPVRNGRKMPVEASDFTAKSALFLQFCLLCNISLPISGIHSTFLRILLRSNIPCVFLQKCVKTPLSLYSIEQIPSIKFFLETNTFSPTIFHTLFRTKKAPVS